MGMIAHVQTVDTGPYFFPSPGYETDDLHISITLKLVLHYIWETLKSQLPCIILFTMTGKLQSGRLHHSCTTVLT